MQTIIKWQGRAILLPKMGAGALNETCSVTEGEVKWWSDDFCGIV